MGSQDPSCMSESSVDGFLISRTVAYWMVEGIVVARCKHNMKKKKNQRITRLAYFKDLEKMPLCNLMVSDHADIISLIKATSASNFSAMTQLHTSIPEEIADGVATPKGKVTK